MYLTFPKTYSYLGGFYFGSIDYYHMLALIGYVPKIKVFMTSTKVTPRNLSETMISTNHCLVNILSKFPYHSKITINLLIG